MAKLTVEVVQEQEEEKCQHCGMPQSYCNAKSEALDDMHMEPCLGYMGEGEYAGDVGEAS